MFTQIVIHALMLVVLCIPLGIVGAVGIRIYDSYMERREARKRSETPDEGA